MSVGEGPGPEDAYGGTPLDELELHGLLVPIPVGPADDVLGFEIGALDVTEGDLLVPDGVRRPPSQGFQAVPLGRSPFPPFQEPYLTSRHETRGNTFPPLPPAPAARMRASRLKRTCPLLGEDLAWGDLPIHQSSIRGCRRLGGWPVRGRRGSLSRSHRWRLRRRGWPVRGRKWRCGAGWPRGPDEQPEDVLDHEGGQEE